MTKNTEEKIQKIELETVKAVTELRSDVKNLTEIIRDLRKTIQDMSNSYVKKEEHIADIADLKLDLAEAKRAGKIRAILWSILTALLTSVAIYEITRAIK